MMRSLPLGKLPPVYLEKILAQAPVHDPRVVLGPGIGLDCAVLSLGDIYLVLKSDPITFATEAIGWYVVQINANDIATTGATPRWFLVTALLPEGKTTFESVEAISAEIFDACRNLEISVIGGHTEITPGLERPILVGTMIGEVPRQALITPRGASPGDQILLTKGVPIEGTAILAREFSERLRDVLTEKAIRQARDYVYRPGISIVRDAHIAAQAGKVTAMHDPTEGGLAGALWELAQACGHTLIINPNVVPVSEISKTICQTFDINPLETIASGALLLTSPPEDAHVIRNALERETIPCVKIGWVEAGNPQVLQNSPEGRIPLPRPYRDEIARLFESMLKTT